MPLIDLNGLGHFKDRENAMIASDYSASSTYAVGDYVYYNGTLYRCKSAITTAEAWTAGHWETAVLANAVSELNTNLTGVNNSFVRSQYDMTKSWAWAVGTLNATSGISEVSSKRIRSAFLKQFNGISFAPGYKGEIYAYSSDGVYIGIWNGSNFEKQISWLTGDVFADFPKNYQYRVLLSKTDDSSITTDAYTNAKFIYYATNEVNAIRDSITVPVNIFQDQYNWARKTVGTSAGSYRYESSTTRIATYPLSNISKFEKLIVTVSSGYKFVFCAFPDTTMGYRKHYIDWTTESQEIDVSEDTYGCILIAKTNNGTITLDDFDKVTIQAVYSGSRIDKISNDFPSYYQDQFENNIVKIRTKMLDAGINGETFAFISDLHWSQNVKISPLLMKSTFDNLSINRTMCGGDIITGGEKTKMMNSMADCVSKFKTFCDFYTLFGNHDTNRLNDATSADYFTKGQTYALMQKQMDSLINYAEPCYYYFDNPTTKTRFICLDTGLESSTLGTNQSNWIDDTLSSTPSGYHILVFAHIIYQTTTSWHVGLLPSELDRTDFMDAVCSKLDTFNANNADKKVEAIFGGHVHIDCNFASEGGIPIILIDTDSLLTFETLSDDDTARNNAIGTVNEQCFDVVTINYDESKIDCVRFGRGEDRSFTY